MNLDSRWAQHLPLAPLDFIRAERAAGKQIFPQDADVFRALELCPLESVKVVILGQDPYHGEGQAMGLAFSVPPTVALPPSLRNIYRELTSDLGVALPNHGDLSAWARRGVLLLNTVLTVEAGKAGSHHHKGWELFTDKIIESLSREQQHVVFILWGAPAQKKASLVDRERHHIISSVHPSPLSAYKGFFDSKPFSRANEFLRSKKIAEIDWRLQ